MSLEAKEPFVVRVNVAGYQPKAWIVWTNFSSDALVEVLERLDVSEPNIWIVSRPATPDECIQNPVSTYDNTTLVKIPRFGGGTEI